MIFTYTPILDTMIEFYKTPRETQGRFFDGYLPMLQTKDKKDMQQPLAFFNPMGKEHILEKLFMMKENGFEDMMKKYCEKYSDIGIELQTYFNLADDIIGGWTTRESTHELSLRIQPYIKRNFCVIVSYASENIDEKLIDERVKFYTELYSTKKV